MIPFSNQAQFIPGYRGLIMCAMRSPNVKFIDGDMVYKNDTFEFSRGAKNYLRHSWKLGEPRGEIIGGYAKVNYKDESIDFEIMDLVQLEKVRAISKNKGGSIWVEHKDEMYRKAPIRRLAKRLTLTSEEDAAALQRAVHLDEVASEGIPQGLDVEKLDEKGEPEVAYFAGEQEAKFEDVSNGEEKKKLTDALLEGITKLPKSANQDEIKAIISEIDRLAASEKISKDQRSMLLAKLAEREDNGEKKPVDPANPLGLK